MIIKGPNDWLKKENIGVENRFILFPQIFHSSHTICNTAVFVEPHSHRRDLWQFRIYKAHKKSI